MEQSKHSEEQTIKLGKKLVKELDLEYSTNTLGRWMSHYLAELMLGIDEAKTENEKKLVKRECCEVILQLWSQKENLPIRNPLDDLGPVVEILKTLKEKEDVGIFPKWLGRLQKLNGDNQWTNFADAVVANSEEIFEKIVRMNLHQEILVRDEEWMKENKAFLSREEAEFLKVIDILNKYKTGGGGVVDLNNFELSENNREKLRFMFDEMEKLLDEQKEELLKVKRLYKLED
jgi:hypothetical protein